MKLSENQKVVQKLKQILEDYPGLEYEENGSEGMSDALIIKLLPDVRCDISTVGNIARKLSEFTGDVYNARLRDSSDGSTLDNLRSFKLILQKPNRNVRITYPDNRDGKLEVDIIQGVEISLEIDDTLWCFAEGNELEIHFNIFAQPNYRKFLRSHVTKFTRNYNNPPDGNNLSNSEFNKIDESTGLSD
ncbi:MAG: hypothetical protein OXN25_03905 [Candidatus Poribacteria bacterium]|nr:hypothetical protein [Candidatus Poribacteria bacterium]